jgi:hypothetical protein
VSRQDDETDDETDGLERALKEGFGDGVPFVGDACADFRATAWQVAEAEALKSALALLRGEIEKSRMMTEMGHAVRMLPLNRREIAFDAWERALKSWKDWDADDMRRELEPWLSPGSHQATEPQVGIIAADAHGERDCGADTGWWNALKRWLGW